MKKSKGARVIERVAVEHNVSVAEVRLEIQKAIDDAFENKDQNAYAKDFWNKWKGRKPTPEEVIVAVSKNTVDILNVNAITNK